MLEKNANREMTQRPKKKENSDILELKDFHHSHIEKWGNSWNQHSLVTIQRQTISRILYYNEL